MRRIYETWKPVKGLEETYQINNWGECKSVARMRKSRKRKDGSYSYCFVPEKYLKAKKDKDGYLVYSLCTGKHKQIIFPRAAVLVAEAFIPNPDNLPVVNHINGNRDMNLVDNLEWVSNKDNNSMEKALHKKHTPVVVNGVWYISIRGCARELGVDPKTVSYWIKNGYHGAYVP